jgi:arsenate reductase
MHKPRVLFLCTGNSCRSQMAEGLVNRYLRDEWRAYSAGTQPAGYVHPMAVQVMSELGIDISSQRSKPTDEFRECGFDTVVTVCDDAAQNCPAWLGSGRRLHVGFEDPARATGSEEERLAVFRRVRDQIRMQIPSLLDAENQGERLHFSSFSHPNPFPLGSHGGGGGRANQGAED